MTPETSFHISSLVHQVLEPVPAIDGRLPEQVLAPRCEEEFQQAVVWARENRCALVPVGGATELAQGNPFRADRWCAVSTALWQGVVEYSPEDLVITVRAGTPLQAVQSVLKDHGQMLPFDPPFAGRATLGGITATNAHGLWRPAFGLPRDRLLGLRFVTGEGKIVKAGGKVVKNVAGYDMGKLLAGSWGTLGIITEVTYKTHPLPRSRRILLAEAESSLSILEAALSLYRARLEPAYAVASVGPRARLVIGLMGNPKTCDWQSARVEELLKQAGLHAEPQPAEALVAMEEDLRNTGAGCAAALRAIMPPSSLPDFWQNAGPSLRGCAAAIVQVPLGLADLFFGSSAAVKTAFAAVESALPSGGRLVWRKAPPELAVTDVWGRFGNEGAFRLMAALKAELDPAGILSPGRFIGRL